MVFPMNTKAVSQQAETKSLLTSTYYQCINKIFQSLLINKADFYVLNDLLNESNFRRGDSPESNYCLESVFTSRLT